MDCVNHVPLGIFTELLQRNHNMYSEPNNVATCSPSRAEATAFQAEGIPFELNFVNSRANRNNQLESLKIT